jgi:hypothetical protein
VAAYVGEEELQAVGRTRDGTRLVLRLLGLLLGRVGAFRMRDFDAVRLQLTLEQLGLVLAEVVLEHESLDIGAGEVASVLLAALDEGLHVLGFEQFDQLVLSQESGYFLSNRRLGEATNLLSLRRFSSCFQGESL